MSSATQTNDGSATTRDADDSATARDADDSATALDADDSANSPPLPLANLVTGGLFAVGCLVILYINRWHFGPPVFFLCTAWLSILLIGRYLWAAGISAALDDGDSSEDFWKPIGRRDELLQEKRALLKAIKEIEFDREMGKMSDEDAAEISVMYRNRAIAVIKALEQGDEPETELSLDDRIDNEVRARLAVASAGERGNIAGKQKKSRTAAKFRAKKAAVNAQIEAESRVAEAEEAEQAEEAATGETDENAETEAESRTDSDSDSDSDSDTQPADKEAAS